MCITLGENIHGFLQVNYYIALTFINDIPDVALDEETLCTSLASPVTQDYEGKTTQ